MGRDQDGSQRLNWMLLAIQQNRGTSVTFQYNIDFRVLQMVVLRGLLVNLGVVNRSGQFITGGEGPMRDSTWTGDTLNFLELDELRF